MPNLKESKKQMEEDYKKWLNERVDMKKAEEDWEAYEEILEEENRPNKQRVGYRKSCRRGYGN